MSTNKKCETAKKVINLCKNLMEKIGYSNITEKNKQFVHIG